MSESGITWQDDVWRFQSDSLTWMNLPDWHRKTPTTSPKRHPTVRVWRCLTCIAEEPGTWRSQRRKRWQQVIGTKNPRCCVQWHIRKSSQGSGNAAQHSGASLAFTGTPKSFVWKNECRTSTFEPNPKSCVWTLCVCVWTKLKRLQRTAHCLSAYLFSLSPQKNNFNNSRGEMTVHIFLKDL